SLSDHLPTGIFSHFRSWGDSPSTNPSRKSHLFSIDGTSESSPPVKATRSGADKFDPSKSSVFPRVTTAARHNNRITTSSAERMSNNNIVISASRATDEWFPALRDFCQPRMLKSSFYMRRLIQWSVLLSGL